MLFHKNNHNKFITVGKKLKTKTFESITKFFEAQFTTNKNDGMLELMEFKRIKKHAHLKLKNKLHNKILACKDEHCTYRVKHKIASRDAQCRPYNDCEEQCWYINCNRDRDRAYDDKRGAVKHPRIKHPGYHDR
jgi:hypothetical protein